MTWTGFTGLLAAVRGTLARLAFPGGRHTERPEPPSDLRRAGEIGSSRDGAPAGCRPARAVAQPPGPVKPVKTWQPISIPADLPEPGAAAYLDQLSQHYSTVARFAPTLEHVTRLWEVADVAYRRSAVSERDARAGPGVGQRRVLSAKFNRTFGRTVVRITKNTRYTENPTVIEKTYVVVGADAGRHPQEDLFYLHCTAHGSAPVRIPHVIDRIVGPGGIVLVLEDLANTQRGGFRSTKFTFSIDGMRPVMDAIATFNHGPSMMSFADTAPRPDLTSIYEHSRAAETMPWIDPVIHYDDADAFIARLARDVTWFRKASEALTAYYSDTVRVLSHNDIANGNILSNRDGQFALIDFEYVSATPPGYDIGNLLVFVLRTCLERNKIPTVDDFTAFHRGLVETYVEHARALGFTHDRDLVFEASALAFVNRLVRTPKAIRTLLRSKETPVGHKLILLQVMAGMLDALTGTGVQPEALSAAAVAPREAAAGRGS